MAPLAAVPVLDQAVAQPVATVRFAPVRLEAAVFLPVPTVCRAAAAAVTVFARAQAAASCSAEAALSLEGVDAYAAYANKDQP